MSAPTDRYVLRFPVRPEHIDELGHVNNVVYLGWVQDAAVAHWGTAADAADQEVLAWVATRHEIDYLRAAMPGDDIVVETWIGVAVGRDFERHTEIFRSRDHKLLCRARTLWCPIDRATGRPTQVSDSVRARFSVEANS